MRKFIGWGFLVLLAGSSVLAQAKKAAPSSNSIVAAKPDVAIASALRQISSTQIKYDIQTLVNFGNRSTLASEVKDLPTGQGTLAAADWIEAQFKAYSAACGGCLEVKRDDFVEPGKAGSRILQPTRLVNVYAVLHGTDPEQAKRMYLVSGHYDSRVNDVMDAHSPAPGANDDASGVAVSLECARVLSQEKFPATIVFVAVSGEEQGLNGSAHLAKLARSEGWQIDAVLNDDIVGGDRTPGQDVHAVRVFSEGVPAAATLEEARRLIALGQENDSPARELARAIAEVSQTYLPTAVLKPVLIYRKDRFLRGGDHTSFSAEGFAAVRFTEWQENFNHQHQAVRMENGTQFGDLIQYVDMDYVARVARLNAAVLGTLASAPGRPQQVKLLTSGLDNSSELTWSASSGASGYEVVWRDTNEALWGHAAMTSEPHLKLNVSKDNVIFAVRSVDAAGHRSVAVLPVPAR